MLPLKRNDELLKLLKISEDLVFSFPVPQDVIDKYEALRKKVFSKFDILYTPLNFRKYHNLSEKKIPDSLPKDPEVIPPINKSGILKLETSNIFLKPLTTI